MGDFYKKCGQHWPTVVPADSRPLSGPPIGALLLTVMSAVFLRLFAAAIQDISSTGSLCICHWQRFEPVLEITSLHPPLAALRRFPPEGEAWNGRAFDGAVEDWDTPQSHSV